MNRDYYNHLAEAGLKNSELSQTQCLEILTSSQIDIFPLLNAAYEVRKTYFGKEVAIHIINNAQNGFCPEDCHYCSQANSAESGIESYPVKSDAEILKEAKQAYEGGAFRYCMVFAGRGPSDKRVDKLAALIKEIKSKYNLEVCVSAGLLDEKKAQRLKEAGLDRLNHNLNTSRDHYPEICSTHTYDDRINTLKAAQKAKLQICSGLIVGMGESPQQIVEVALTLRELKAQSIPVNFLIPLQGIQIQNAPKIDPLFGLKVLCLFRFLNPLAEIRIAAGRELHFKKLEVLTLYPANSLFLSGYLNARGTSRVQTLRMIQDAGFTIKSDKSLEEIISEEQTLAASQTQDKVSDITIKTLNDLRPFMQPARQPSGNLPAKP